MQERSSYHTSRAKSVSVLATLAALAPAAAFAHHPMGGALPSTFFQGLLSGLGHPVIGVDHLAFLTGIALLAVLAGDRFRAPLALVAATIAGVGLHLWQVDIAGAEIIVALSVAAVALCLLLQVRPGVILLSVAAAGFGVMHGFALGESIVGADRNVVGAYLLGLALVQSIVAMTLVYGFSLLVKERNKAAVAWSRAAGLGIAAVAIASLASSAGSL